MKDAPDARVLAWARTLGPSDLTISVVTVEEIERGLGRLPAGRRRRDLERRWTELVHSFEESIIPYDLSAARAVAAVNVSALDRGRPMSLADAQIAGICLARGIALATRNVADFENVDGLTIINPFDGVG